MSGAFHIAAIGLEAQQRALDTIAGNITNVNTPGYKRSDVRFSEVMAGRADGAAVSASLGSSPSPAGVAADQVYAVNSAGRIATTGGALDVAVDGHGFLEVMAPGGETLLWRGGTLKVGEDGLLATAQGLPLKAAISVPSDASGIEIGADGVVRALAGDAGAEKVEIGQLMLVKVPDAAALERLDGGLYRVDEGVTLLDAQPGEDGVGMFVQGGIEQSNVELTTEMVQLMMVQRAYAANAQIVQAADQLMAIANGLRR